MSETLSPPQDELDLLVAMLAATTSLQGIKIFSDSDSISKVTAPPRIVLYADEGQYQAAADKRTSITGNMLELVAAIWGGSLRECRYIRTLLFRAFEEARATSAEFPWVEWEKAGTEKYNTGPDTTINGAGMQLRFKVLISIDRVPLGTGLVEETSLTKV